MNIASIDYNLKLKSLDIYVSGCKSPHCVDCHNKELWDFNVGRPWEDWCAKLKQHIENDMVTNIMFFGGDPLDQDLDELEGLLYWIDQLTNKPIWIFTKYQIHEISDTISKYCSYIKTGRYIKERPSIEYPEYNITLASDNQEIHKLIP